MALTHAERQKKWATENPEAYKAAVQRWRKNNPHKVRTMHQRWRKRHPAKLWSQGQRRHAKYLEVQENLAGRPKPDACEVCCTAGMVVFDHDHKTGEFRGWLCPSCNSALGWAKDNPEILELLAFYLRSFQ